MPRTPARITRALFSLAMAGGLAFGVQSAFADVREAYCPWNPYTGEIAKSCAIGAAGDAYCDQQCKNTFDSESRGFCESPVACCRCAF